MLSRKQKKGKQGLGSRAIWTNPWLSTWVVQPIFIFFIRGPLRFFVFPTGFFFFFPFFGIGKGELFQGGDPPFCFMVPFSSADSWSDFVYGLVCDLFKPFAENGKKKRAKGKKPLTKGFCLVFLWVYYFFFIFPGEGGLFWLNFKNKGFSFFIFFLVFGKWKPKFLVICFFLVTFFL